MKLFMTIILSLQNSSFLLQKYFLFPRRPFSIILLYIIYTYYIPWLFPVALYIMCCNLMKWYTFRRDNGNLVFFAHLFFFNLLLLCNLYFMSSWSMCFDKVFDTWGNISQDLWSVWTMELNGYFHNLFITWFFVPKNFFQDQPLLHIQTNRTGKYFC